MERRILAFVCVIAATVCVGLSIYGGWSLREMGLDHRELLGGSYDWNRYGELYDRTGLISESRFLGNGWIGTLAPTVFAVLGITLLWTGWNLLEVVEYYDDDDDDDDDDPIKEDLPEESAPAIHAVASSNDNRDGVHRTGTSG